MRGGVRSSPVATQRARAVFTPTVPTVRQRSINRVYRIDFTSRRLRHTYVDRAAHCLLCTIQVNDACEADPLNFGHMVTTHMGNEMVKLGIATTDAAPSFRPSLLLLHGDADKVCKKEGTALIYKTVPSIDKRMCLYPGLKHEILMEPGTGGREDVMADVLSWMHGRMTIYRLMSEDA